VGVAEFAAQCVHAFAWRAPLDRDAVSAEDQLRAPFERLFVDLAGLWNLPKNAVAAVGESSVSNPKTRPDSAVTVRQTFLGFMELRPSPAKARTRASSRTRATKPRGRSSIACRNCGTPSWWRVRWMD
jgi:hypothetical protein